jgi:Tfp pilus assembly protein PilE
MSSNRGFTLIGLLIVVALARDFSVMREAIGCA